MKYPYYFEYIVDTLTLRLPKEINMFSHFIGQISTGDRADEFIQIIDEVRAGKHDEYEIFYNAPTVLIRPEITAVSRSDIIDDPALDQYRERDRFRELILIWKEKIPVGFIDEDTKL